MTVATVPPPELDSTSPRLHQDRKKRKPDEELEADYNTFELKSPTKSEAAKFNQRVLKKIQLAFDRDPERDLQLCFPAGYSDRLQSKVKANEHKEQNVSDHSVQHESQETNSSDIRSMLNADYSVEVVHPLSPAIRELILSQKSTSNKENLSGVAELLAASKVIHTGPRTVFRCSPDTVAKVVWDAEDYTEYTMLQFLNEHAPNIPAAKPLGVARVGQVSLIFSSYIPGEQLTKVWPQLKTQQKVSLMVQLGKIISDLRSIPYPPHQPLGGVAGEGCKDLRRYIRRSKHPVYTVAEHDKFLLSNARFGSEIYLNILRSCAPDGPAQICLSHGDIRPDNIIVQQSGNGSYAISGLVDWEFSGFYPSHYECTKATNCLGTDETSDWYNYLPGCISPSQQGQRWLFDYVIGWLLE